MVEFDQDAEAADPGPQRTQPASRPASPTRGANGLDLPESQYAALANTIENQIIPRLMLAHRLDAPARQAERPDTQEETSISILAFTNLVRTRETMTLRAHVVSLLSNGMSLDDLLLNLLAPTARYLGQLWHEDECSFVDVTLALCKLQYLLREFGEADADGEDQSKARFKVLLSAVPGEQHSFGISMVEGFFKRSGWNVRSIPNAAAAEIIGAVRQERFAVAGLSMSGDHFAPNLPALIGRMRKASRNRSLIVLVGGNYFNEHPAQALAVGADATAADALHAVARTANAVNGITRN